MAIVKLPLQPVEESYVLKDRIYDALKTAITSVNIYATDEEHRLDERQLSEDLRVSRTPIREAICRLEQEGLVRTIPRRGAFVVRKTKGEVLEMITVWAALESMAARLATERASDEEIASLRTLFATFNDAEIQAHIDEYSQNNVEFHQAIMKLGKCALIEEIAANLFVHMRWIRMRTIADNDRAARSIIDHIHIIESLEQREAELAERLVREHALNLARHVAKNVHYLS
jgi:DNA-binding GntR family transcriptional regulator